MNEAKEWRFIVDYIHGQTIDFYIDACKNQFMALWTAYCLHNDLYVDTAKYDVALMDLFNALSIKQRRALCHNCFPKFDDLMGAWLA